MIKNTPEKWVSLAVHTGSWATANLGMIAVSEGYAYGCDGHRIHKCKTSISNDGLYDSKQIMPVTKLRGLNHHATIDNYPIDNINKLLMNVNNKDSISISKDQLELITLESGLCCYYIGDLFDTGIYYNANFIDEAFNGFSSAMVTTVEIQNVFTMFCSHEFGYSAIQELKVIL